MSELPQGWVNAEFGNLNEFSSKNIDPSEYPDEVFELYSVPIFPTGKPEFSLGKHIGSTKQQVQPGDVLVCKINPRINRVWVVGRKTKFRQIASSEWIVMRAEGHDPRFFGRFFTSGEFRELLCTDLTGVGGSLTRAQPKRVATYEVPVAPLAEQKRIADKLDALLARVDATREHLAHIPTLLKRFRQSVLAAATSGRLTEDWRAENPSAMSIRPVHHRTDTEQPPPKGLVGGEGWASPAKPNLQASWQEVTVGQIASLAFDGPFGSNLKSDDYSEEGVRVVRLENIGWMDFLLEKETFVPQEKYQSLKRHTLLESDVLFSSFVAEEVRVCLLPSILSGTAINKADCFCVRVNPDFCEPKFLLFRLACNTTYQHFAGSIHGATRPRINIKQLKSFGFGLPSLPEQKEIIRRVEALFALADKVEARYTTARAQVDKLTPALLAKAFRGELVDQDPNDEPADQLLARLREARASEPVKRTRGKRTQGV